MSDRRTDLTACYTNRRTALKLVANFSEHWELLEKTYGYKSARIKVPYRSGADFWVHINLIAQPATKSDEAKSPPEIEFQENDGPFYFELAGTTLTVIVPLNLPELWGTVKGRTTPLLYVNRSITGCSLCKWKEDIWLDLRVWITSEADRPPLSPQRDHGQVNTLFGGQFESNRQRY